MVGVYDWQLGSFWIIIVGCEIDEVVFCVVLLLFIVIDVLVVDDESLFLRH